MTEEAKKEAYTELDKNLEFLALYYGCTVDDVQTELLLDATREEIKGIHSAITFDDMIGRRRISSIAASARIFMFCSCLFAVIGLFAFVIKFGEYLYKVFGN